MLNIIDKIKGNPILRKLLFDMKVPAHLSENFRFIPELLAKYREIIEKNEPTAGHYRKKELYYKNSFNFGNERLEYFRHVLVPWLDSVRRLKGLRMLEIGCGTGSSTIAFAEQGVHVTAIDFNENFLFEAKSKCQLYGLNVRFILLNAADVKKILEQEIFDIIVFMASIEHMTIQERIQSLSATYELLPGNGLLCITGSPNRLHFKDSHTFNLPFFNWLPDELAIRYARFSERSDFNRHMSEIDDAKEKTVQLYRWGRGFSFHEIELAVKPLSELKIKSDLKSFMRKRNILYGLGSRFASNDKYERFLHKLYPGIDRAFFQPYIDIIIEKDS